jgi:predicted GIY-YIG superfamily endonuclease
MGQRTALYRFYDAHGMLLYIGITNSPGRRWQQHMEEKPWYPQVRHQAVTWYGSERQARRVETRAIRAERPKFNVVGAVRPAGWRFDLQDQPLLGYAAVLLCVPGAYFGMARLFPAVKPLAVLSVWAVLAAVLAIAIIRASHWIRRFGRHLERAEGPDVRAEARILQLVGEGVSASKAGVLVGRSDSYGRKVVRTARDLAKAAPKGPDAEEAS